MASPTRQTLIDSYGQAPAELAAALAALPRAMWQYRPAPDQWTIHETIVHITDSEVNSYVRCRRLIAEPGSPVLGYDEAGWARALDYHAQDPEAALALFGALRQASYLLIRALPEAAWANTIHHSENGEMTFDAWLEVYERHVRDHVAQMRGVHAAWLAAGRPQ